MILTGKHPEGGVFIEITEGMRAFLEVAYF
jgi:hypothetical protein